MRYLLTFTVCAFLCFSPALAEDTSGFDMEAENIAGAYAECAAYYRLVYFAMQQSNEEEAAKSYRQLEDAAMLYSLVMSQEGRTKDKAIEVTNSRIEMYLKKMKQETDNRNENISILINSYHEPCTEKMENPSAKLAEAIAQHSE